MAEYPIMPLRVAILLADTTHMNNEEFGAYVRILCALWLRGGIIREDELRKISQLSSYKFSKSFEKISRELTFVDGMVSQKRLTDTWLQVQDKRRSASKSASRRWEHEKTMRPHMRPYMPTQCERNAIKTKEVSRSLSDASSQSIAAPQQGAFEMEVAKPSSPLSPSSELVAIMAKKAKGWK